MSLSFTNSSYIVTAVALQDRELCLVQTHSTLCPVWPLRAQNLYPATIKTGFPYLDIANFISESAKIVCEQYQRNINRQKTGTKSKDIEAEFQLLT